MATKAAVENAEINGHVEENLVEEEKRAKEDCKNSVDKELPTVLVTGFGLFRDYTSNSSILAVNELAKEGIPGINLVTREIPVEYEAVSRVIPKLWNIYDPVLTVHCGMHALTTTIVLEQIANNKGYISRDNEGKIPTDSVCRNCGPDTLNTSLNMASVCDKLNMCKAEVPAVCSKDAGRFLCEFIYFTSLSIKPTTAFIHVPPIGKPYSASQLAKSIRLAIIAMLEQLGIVV